MGLNMKSVLIIFSLLTIIGFTFVVPIIPYLLFCNETEIDREYFSDVVIDSTGDIIVTGIKRGEFAEDIVYGDTNTSGLLVLRFDRSGSLVQSVLIGYEFSDLATQVLVDDGDNLIISGVSYEAGFTVDGIEYSSILLKLSPGGELMWIRYFREITWDIFVDGSGKVYRLGLYSGGYGINVSRLYGVESEDSGIVAMVYAPDGVLVETLFLNGRKDDTGYWIRADMSGNIYIYLTSESTEIAEWRPGYPNTMVVNISSDRSISRFRPEERIFELEVVGGDLYYSVNMDGDYTDIGVYSLSSNSTSTKVSSFSATYQEMVVLGDKLYIDIYDEIIDLSSGKVYQLGDNLGSWYIADGTLVVLSTTSDPTLIRHPTYQKEIRGESDAYVRSFESYGEVESWGTYLGWEKQRVQVQCG